MASKDRRSEVYSISLIDKSTLTLIGSNDILSNILTSFFTTRYTERSPGKPVGNIFEIKKCDLTYFFEKDDVIINDDLINVKLSYLISNKKLNIIDKHTLLKTGEKAKNEGDEEKQHLTIKLFKNTGQALLVFEKVTGGITISSITDELNKYINSSLYTGLAFNSIISIKPTPGESFLADLLKAKRISLVKMTIDRADLNSDIDYGFSGEDDNLRDTAELIYKSKLKSKIKISQIEKLYNAHKTTPNKILRIIVEASGESGKIKLDTEGAKMAKYIKTNLDLNGLVDTDDIISKFNIFINSIPIELLGVVIDEVSPIECEG